MNRIDVNEKKLGILLYIVSAIVYCGTYFGIYKLICDNLLNLSIGLLNIIDLIVIFVFVLSVVPCCFLLKKLIVKFLEK